MRTRVRAVGDVTELLKMVADKFVVVPLIAQVCTVVPSGPTTRRFMVPSVESA